MKKRIYYDNMIAGLEDAEGVALNPDTGLDRLHMKQKPLTLSAQGYEGRDSIGVEIAFSTKSQNTKLMTQGKDVQLGIDAQGFVEAKLGSAQLSSKEEQIQVVKKAHGVFGSSQYVPTATKTITTGQVNDGKLHSVVLSRQANGMIKLYVDGNLVDSVYEESKRNEMIRSAPVVLGDSKFDATIEGFSYRDHSLPDERDLLDGLHVPGEMAENRSKWTVKACSEMPHVQEDSNAQAAIDGGENTWWHTNYTGADTHKGPHWLQIDFHGTQNIDAIDYVKRGNANGDPSKIDLYFLQNGTWNLY